MTDTRTRTFYHITIWHSDPDDHEIIDIVRGDYWDEPEYIAAPIEEIHRIEESWQGVVKYLSDYERKYGRIWSAITEQVVEIDDSDIPY